MNLTYLVDELRLNGVLGRKKSSDTLNVYTSFQSPTSLLLHVVYFHSLRDLFIAIRRTSRQRYRITVFSEVSCEKSCSEHSFGNYRLTADFIKNLIK